MLHERCREIGRDPATIRVAAGLNPCWPYRDVTVTGKQRMMEQHDVPSIMNMSVADAESRVAEIAAWNELGLDRLVCAAPGVADTDESLYELVEHLAAAGAPLRRDPRRSSPNAESTRGHGSIAHRRPTDPAPPPRARPSTSPRIVPSRRAVAVGKPNSKSSISSTPRRDAGGRRALRWVSCTRISARPRSSRHRRAPGQRGDDALMAVAAVVEQEEAVRRRGAPSRASGPRCPSTPAPTTSRRRRRRGRTSWAGRRARRASPSTLSPAHVRRRGAPASARGTPARRPGPRITDRPSAARCAPPSSETAAITRSPSRPSSIVAAGASRRPDGKARMPWEISSAARRHRHHVVGADHVRAPSMRRAEDRLGEALAERTSSSWSRPAP